MLLLLQVVIVDIQSYVRPTSCIVSVYCICANVPIFPLCQSSRFGHMDIWNMHMCRTSTCIMHVNVSLFLCYYTSFSIVHVSVFYTPINYTRVYILHTRIVQISVLYTCIPVLHTCMCRCTCHIYFYYTVPL